MEKLSVVIIFDFSNLLFRVKFNLLGSNWWEMLFICFIGDIWL